MTISPFFTFARRALGRTVFVDMDGTILKAFEIPAYVTGNKLMWWNQNLDVTDIILNRALYLVILKALGCKLVVWTNRPESKKDITIKALGIFSALFSEFQFHAGKKVANADMFIIDDDKKFAGINTLTVTKIK